MALRELKQYIELFHLVGIDDFFIESSEFALNIKTNNNTVTVENHAIPSLVCISNQNNILDDNTNDLNLLKKKYSQCKRCSYSKNRIKFVYGDGNQNAKCLVIGDPPNSDENLMGKPFVGKSGQLFEKMLAAINMSRNDVYLTNICKCKINLNHQNLQEIKSCIPYLKQQIEIISPKIILVFGELATKFFLELNSSYDSIRQNQPYFYNQIPVFTTYNPTLLIEKTELKKNAWLDLQKFRDHYNTL